MVVSLSQGFAGKNEGNDALIWSDAELLNLEQRGLRKRNSHEGARFNPQHVNAAIIFRQLLLQFKKTQYPKNKRRQRILRDLVNISCLTQKWRII